MHDIISNFSLVKSQQQASASQSAATKVPPVTGAKAYIDTVKIYCWRPLPVDVLTSLREHYRNRLLVEVRPVPGKCKQYQRALITVHQPHVNTFRQLKLLQPGRFAITQVHTAVDFLCATEEHANDVHSLLKARIVQRWRRRGQESHVEIATAYGNRNKRAARNSALYKALSKIDGAPCCHFELRFVGAQACDRAGLGSFDRLIEGLDPLPLLQHETNILFIDEGAIDRLANKLARLSKRRHPEISMKRIKGRVLGLLARRVANAEFRPDKDPLSKARAQQIYDLGPPWRACLRKSLDWGIFTPQPRWHHW